MKSTWTIRQMFLWVFIVALTLPYIVAMIPKRASTLDASLINANTMEEWLREIDPSAEVTNVGGSSSSTGYYSQEELDYLITMKNASADWLFVNLQKQFSDQINKSYSQRSCSVGVDSFSFVVSDGHSRRHFYLWYAPPDSAYGASRAGENSMRIKVLQIVYQVR